MKRAETIVVPDIRDHVVIVVNCVSTKTNRLPARVQRPPEQRALNHKDIGYKRSHHHFVDHAM